MALLVRWKVLLLLLGQRHRGSQVLKLESRWLLVKVFSSRRKVYSFKALVLAYSSRVMQFILCKLIRSPHLASAPSSAS